MIHSQIASHMCHTDVTRAFIALGANLPGPYGVAEKTVRRAAAALSDVTSHAVKVSRFFRTPAFPAGSGPDFVNAAAAFDWAGTAQDLLEITQQIETRFGRTRQHRWEARVLDIDLLGLGAQVLPDWQTEQLWRALPPDRARVETPDELILPHPRLSERAFVLVPLLDVAPDWRHPVLGRTVAEMCDALTDAERAEITAL